MKIRLENHEPGHNKYYEMEVFNGTASLRTTYGKIGTVQSDSSKSFSTVRDAEDELMSMAKKKIAKGYKQVSASSVDIPEITKKLKIKIYEGFFG